VQSVQKVITLHPLEFNSYNTDGLRLFLVLDRSSNRPFQDEPAREGREYVQPVGVLSVMKGIVLAGGTGSRLRHLTKITNKHLLPIYDKPMIYYPIETLVEAGITDLLIVTGGRYAGDFLRLLGNGEEFGLKHINYTYQEGEGGIAAALALAAHFAGGNKICVLLGDNIFQRSIRRALEDFECQERGAKVLLKQVPDPERFGVAEIRGQHIVGIEEKPVKPKSYYAVTGIYMYDETVFDKMRTLKPSARGELEITDLNNAYIKEGTMDFDFVEGWWADAGTCDSLIRAANLVYESHAKQQPVLVGAGL
jgi:glucose-1-phosphate thymidylyltransferase